MVAMPPPGTVLDVLAGPATEAGSGYGESVGGQLKGGKVWWFIILSWAPLSS